MHIVFVEPEIPPNTGTTARLCAATQTTFHLVGPLGFSLEDRYLKRAGLDYWPYVDVLVYESWSDFLARRPPGRLLAFSAHAEWSYTQASYAEDDLLVFVEVRTRHRSGFGSPEESLTAKKRSHMASSALRYLQRNRISDREWRIDLVAIEIGPGEKPVRVDVTENAVEV